MKSEGLSMEGSLSPVFTKGRLLRYGPMIRWALQETNEINDMDECLVDVLKGFNDKSKVKKDINVQFTIRQSSVDLLVEKKVLSVRETGWQVQKAKQRLLESRIRKEIDLERPEDHLRRFTRAFRKTVANDVSSPDSEVLNTIVPVLPEVSKVAKRKRVATIKLPEVKIQNME